MKKISFIVLASVMAACASSDGPTPFATYDPPPTLVVSPLVMPTTHWGSKEKVTLEMALTAARNNSPALKAAQFRIAAQQHAQRAAGQYPNSEVTLGNEKIGLSQPIVLGGDLDSEEKIATAQLGIVEAEYQQAILQVDATLRGAFASLLMLQLANDYQAQRLVLAGQSLSIVRAQVDAGEIANDATTSLLLEQASLQAQQDTLSVQLDAARHQLATLVGAVSNDFIAVGELNTIVKLPRLEELLANIEQLPSVAKSLSQTQVAKMQRDLAYAQAIPDFNIELFYTADEQIEASVLFELPLNRQRRELHRSAQQQLLAAQSDAELSAQQMRLALQEMHSQLKRATTEYSRASTIVIDTLQQQLLLTKSRFEAGDISLESLNNAESMLLRAQISSLEAWLNMILAWQRVRSIVRS
ncbi:MAG: outer membrane protein TolC [Myxococcota bacterium]|jgi:outer membrane protein TolC